MIYTCKKCENWIPLTSSENKTIEGVCGIIPQRWKYKTRKDCTFYEPKKERFLNPNFFIEETKPKR